jgi:hypothetical protein
MWAPFVGDSPDSGRVRKKRLRRSRVMALVMLSALITDRRR